MRWHDLVQDAMTFTTLVALAAAVAFAVGLSGCAGYQAMVIQRPPVAEPCGIVVCESRIGRIDYERDCACSGKQSLEDIF